MSTPPWSSADREIAVITLEEAYRELYKQVQRRNPTGRYAQGSYFVSGQSLKFPHQLIN